MCVASVLDCRLMRWYVLRDTAGRTETLYRSSCTSCWPTCALQIPRQSGRLRRGASEEGWIETPQRKRRGSLLDPSRGERLSLSPFRWPTSELLGCLVGEGEVSERRFEKYFGPEKKKPRRGNSEISYQESRFCAKRNIFLENVSTVLRC